MNHKPDLSPLLPDDDGIAARRRALEAEVGRRRARRRAAPRLALAVLALVAAGAGGAWAAGVFSAEDIALNAGVACFEDPHPRGSAAIFHTAADPVAKCARVWREGALGTRLERLEREGRIAPRPNRGAPQLVACTGEGKPVSVFPGRDGLCARFGLEPLPADYGPIGRARARAFAALHAVGAAVPGGRGCLSPVAAAARARARLPERYADVEIVADGSHPCTRAYRTVGGRIVVITAPEGWRARSRER